MWKVLASVVVAGAVGGIVNALVASTGILIPRFVDVGGSTVIELGFLGNAIVGSVAAFVSFGLYGPLANLSLFAARAEAAKTVITVSALAGAVLVGFSGGRWLTAEADRQFAQAALNETAAALQSLAGPADQPPGSAGVLTDSQKQTVRSMTEDIQRLSPSASFEAAEALRQSISKTEPRTP